ncbi:hypothetical protein [Mycolicibacterium sp. CR10]|uniref:hypothetical protein n=1 Tax=Mycolicibacterium sp. CR10 TaxID=2562314 RepID=UPI0010C11647|nr:hypothetical protein [Mycolicibacterium sp. CR10]
MKHAAALFALAAAGLLVAAPAHADGDPANLEALVGQAYVKYQARCTPQTPPSFQGVEWSSGPTGQGGMGTVVDANPSLGGPFTALWNATTDSSGQFQVSDGGSGYWDITFEFC